MKRINSVYLKHFVSVVLYNNVTVYLLMEQIYISRKRLGSKTDNISRQRKMIQAENLRETCKQLGLVITSLADDICLFQNTVFSQPWLICLTCPYRIFWGTCTILIMLYVPLIKEQLKDSAANCYYFRLQLLRDRKRFSASRHWDCG